MVTHLFGYKGHKRLTIINEDPRSYLKRSKKLYDGIMIYPVSPVTLAGNRLFTFEALESMKARLRPDGVLSLQVSGAENYLGPLKEQIILSPWQALGKIFPYRYAVPGSSITFFACQNEGIIPKDVEGYISRFDRRKISTTTFLPMSFYNILQPFRVEELNNWLARPVEAKLNTDAHPESFIQQLELWNIYSGAQINRQLEKLQSISFKQLITFIAGAGLIFLLAMFLTSPIISLKTCVAAGVSVSGATGLLCEIILILLYQNSNGAAYQMSAFFFGVYMFGLAFGAWLFGQIRIENTALKRLKVVKFLQVLFTLLCVVFVSKIEFHNALTIGTAIFIIAFLDGIEFPVADSLFRSTKTRPQTSAGILMFSDNLGALLAGLASGLWLLPTYGMKASFYLLGFMLSINLLFLFILHRRISF
jgi:predicted membrane-bound spermidine synthase